MLLLISFMLATAQPADTRVGKIVHPRGAGTLSCATAFRPENRVATENWIAGFWAAWDMARITDADPVAGNSDLNGIVGEVQKECFAEPSSGLLKAVLGARKAVVDRSTTASSK